MYKVKFEQEAFPISCNASDKMADYFQADWLFYTLFLVLF